MLILEDIMKNGIDMITSETPNKLREIIQDTWPNLYRPPKEYRQSVKIRIDSKCKEV